MENETVVVSPVLRRYRHMTDTFYREFGDLYHHFKNQGFIPRDVADIIMGLIDCKKTVYYGYVRVARVKGYITDSFAENARLKAKRDHEARLARQAASA